MQYAPKTTRPWMTPLPAFAAALALAACGGGSDDGAAAPAEPSAPPVVQTPQVASNCAALASGKYRLVVNQDGGRSAPTEVLTIDAPALKATGSDGEVTSLTPNGTCRYTLGAAGTEAVVTAAGVMVARVQGDGTSLVGALLFPEQTIALADLAGDWNGLGFDRPDDGVAIRPVSLTVSLTDAGKATALTYCSDLQSAQSCEVGGAADLAAIAVRANAAGGFDLVTGGGTDRLFAYRANNQLVWVAVSNGGHITVSTRKAALALPAVGRVNESMNLTLTAQYLAPSAFNQAKSTVASVDAAAGSYVRNRVVNFTTGVTQPETVVVNSPRQGYWHRLAATGVTLSDGSAGNVSELVSLPIAGMDMTVVGVPASSQLQLAAVPGS